MNSHLDYINLKLAERKNSDAFRELGVNNELIDFCSNDYLGLSLKEEIYNEDTFKRHGSTGSRLISGNHSDTVQLEDFLADHYNAESALFFNSGYNANLGLLSCLPNRHDTIFYDEFVHASIRDGISLSKANAYSFRHNDVSSLVSKLRNAKGNVFVVVESIYSMDGDQAPLDELALLCDENKMALIVDEAHAVGLFGKGGRGLSSIYKIENRVFARVITFGKAFGMHGAAVLGKKILKDYLINFSRPFIYTTALPPWSVVSVRLAHEFLRSNSSRIEDLHLRINHFKDLASKLELSFINSDSAIQCIIIHGNDKVKEVAKIVQRDGFDVRSILSPTVPKGKERLRVCLHSFNSFDQIDSLLTSIKTAIE